MSVLSNHHNNFSPPHHSHYFHANLDALQGPYFQKMGRYIPSTLMAPPVIELQQPGSKVFKQPVNKKGHQRSLTLFLVIHWKSQVHCSLIIILLLWLSENSAFKFCALRTASLALAYCRYSKTGWYSEVFLFHEFLNRVVKFTEIKMHWKISRLIILLCWTDMFCCYVSKQINRTCPVCRYNIDPECIQSSTTVWQPHECHCSQHVTDTLPLLSAVTLHARVLHYYV